jgi:hypothetical protein
LARKSNASFKQMDKSSFFFTANCGICHPGGGPTKLDRDGFSYFDATQPVGSQFGWQRAQAASSYTGPAAIANDGDYGNVAGMPMGTSAIAGAWERTGVAEADCLMCHGQMFNWRGRAAAVTAAMTAQTRKAQGDPGGNTGAFALGNGLKPFEVGPAAGAGFASVVCPNGTLAAGAINMPTDAACFPNVAAGKPSNTASNVVLDYAAAANPASPMNSLVLASALTPADRAAIAAAFAKANATDDTAAATGGEYVLKASWLKGKVQDSACMGCHGMPDAKKSGRHYMAEANPMTGLGYDVHRSSTGAAFQCVDCHPAGRSNADPFEGHQIAKGDVIIGGVDDHVDGKAVTCEECHLFGKTVNGSAAPDPTGTHAAFPGLHFEALSCQACHIPEVISGPMIVPVGATDGTNPTSNMFMGFPFPDGYYDMHSTGSQVAYGYTAFGMGTVRNGAGQIVTCTPQTPASADCGPSTTITWKPALRPYTQDNGFYASRTRTKLMTVKPLFTSWYGYWNGEVGSLMKVAPVQLRVVRLALTGSTAASTSIANPRDTADEIRDGLGAVVYYMRHAPVVAGQPQGGYAPPSGWGWPSFKIAVVGDGMVKSLADEACAADQVYTDCTVVEEHDAHAVAETHDFSVNHGVQAIAAKKTLGANGCADCHRPSSPFFFDQELVEVTAAGAGASVKAPRYERMGLSANRAGWLGNLQVAPLLNVYPRGGAGRVYSNYVATQVTEAATIPATPFQVTVANAASFTHDLGVRFTVNGTATAALTRTTGVPVAGEYVVEGGVYTFAEADAARTVAIGYGHVSAGATTRYIDCGYDGTARGSTCTLVPEAGAPSVTLTAAAAPGYSFVRWSGACSGTASTCTLASPATYLEVEAFFAPTSVIASVSRFGSGTGTVAASGAGAISALTCDGLVCTAPVANGQDVTFTATPAATSVVGSWLVPPLCSTPAASRVYTMSGSTCVDAVVAGCTAGSLTCTVTAPAAPETLAAGSTLFKPLLVGLQFVDQ